MRAYLLLTIAVLTAVAEGAAAAAKIDDPDEKVCFAPVGPVESFVELFPVEPVRNAERGFSVALDGDLLAVGAPLDDHDGDELKNAGAVYLFRWETCRWVQVVKLFADLPQRDAKFGSAVALRGGVLAVAALGAGSVHVFTQSAGVWRQTLLLVGAPAYGPGAFGRAIALDDAGDCLAVGAVEPHGRGAGAVYIYPLGPEPPSTCKQARLAPAKPQQRERFGQAVAMAGALVVAGAPGHSGKTAYSGAAYVFQSAGGTWKQLDVLLDPNGREGDQLGAAVATDGSVVAAGAPSADCPEGGDCGALYVANCSESECSDPAALDVPDAAAGDQLGFAVGLKGNLLAAGSPGSAQEDRAGKIRVFRSDGSSWVGESLPAPDNAEGRDLVGFAVAVGGGRVVTAGVLGEQGSAAAGAVWSFDFNPEGGWREGGEAVARDRISRPDDPAAPKAQPLAASSSVFGVSVAATEEFVAVGSRRTPEEKPPGEVYVYRKAAAGWRQEVRLTSPAGKLASDGFGKAVALDGSSLLVGAPIGVGAQGSATENGVAYLFERSAGRWSDVPGFGKENPIGDETLGAAVAVGPNLVMAGDPRMEAPGVVFIAERGAKGWVDEPDLYGKPPSFGDRFGAALSFQDGVLAIGAPGKSAVYVARRRGLQDWSLSEPLTPLANVPVALSAGLGTAVALDGGLLAASAPASNGGAVFLFKATDAESWVPFGPHLSIEPPYGQFGASLDLNGEWLLVGAPGSGGIPGDEFNLSENDHDLAFLFERHGSSWRLAAKVGAALPLVEGDHFGSSVALTDTFFVVTNPGSTGGDRVTIFRLRPPGQEETP